MAVRFGFLARTGPRSALLVAFGGTVALVLGLALGHPSASTLMPAVALTWVVTVGLALVWPFPAFLVLAGSSIFLMVFDIPGDRGINLFDVLLPWLLAASVLGTARAEAREGDRAITDPGGLEVLRARKRLSRAVIVFYGVAALSIVAMVLVGRPPSAVTYSTFGLLRAQQGLLLFPLGLWWLRSERRIHLTIGALIVTGVIVVVANTIALSMGLIGRAGLTWFVNQTEAVIGGPNEVAPAMLLLAVLLLVRHSLRHKALNLVGLAVTLAMLVASTSRSGLLATGTFVALVIPRARWHWVLIGALIVLATIPLIPHDYWTRMGRTLVLQRGTFEAYTSLIRVYGWKNAITVFLHNPVLGVGYVGYESASGDYGPLRLKGVPAEDYYLETASGMGIPGLIALAIVFVRLFRLGAAVRKHTPAGSLGHAMAHYHVPFLI